MIEGIELGRRDGSKFQEALGELFDTRGIVQFLPLGAQHCDLVAFAPHVGAQLGEMLSLDSRVVLDAIDVDRSQHQHPDHNEIEYAQDHCHPRIMSRILSRSCCTSPRSWSERAASAVVCSVS